MTFQIEHLLIAVIGASALALIWVRDLFAVVVVLSVYSGLLAVMFSLMGAVDVAFMEAVVGTTMSTVCFIGLMWWVDSDELKLLSVPRRILSVVPALGLGGLLLYGVVALPPYGDQTAPPMVHVSPSYVQGSVAEMATPNVVAAVLADYRSFDTMIETAVVVAAVLACLLVLRHRDVPSV
jgi:multicomponent Na+:H+ antiporter subunit B